MKMVKEQLEAKIVKFLDSIPYGIFFFDSEWRFTYSNREASKVFPFEKKYAYGKSVWELFPATVGTILEKKFRASIKTKKNTSFIFRTSPGRKYTVECYPFSTGLGVFFKDITLDQKIIQRQQDVISVASHELKTPLTSIVMYSQLLQKYLNKKSDEKANTLMNFLIDQINTLSNLINYLFDTSMIQTGKMKLKKEAVDINILLAELVMNAQKLAITQKISLQSNIQKKIFVDKVRITQVIVNLLNNAIKYSPGEKEIIVKAMEDKDTLKISVQDFGVGILKTKQKEIFTRLYRTDLGEKTAEGLGLGLFIAASIIKAHNGKLWVESAKGKGSTFFFTIPF